MIGIDTEVDNLSAKTLDHVVLSEAEMTLFNTIHERNLMDAHEALVQCLNSDMASKINTLGDKLHIDPDIMALDSYGMVELVMNPIYFGDISIRSQKHGAILKRHNSFSATPIIPSAELAEIFKSDGDNLYLFFNMQKGFMLGSGVKKKIKDCEYIDLKLVDVFIYRDPYNALDFHAKGKWGRYKGRISTQEKPYGSLVMNKVDSPEISQALIPEWYIKNLNDFNMDRIRLMH
jgi:hypothetical protein